MLQVCTPCWYGYFKREAGNDKCFVCSGPYPPGELPPLQDSSCYASDPCATYHYATMRLLCHWD